MSEKVLTAPLAVIKVIAADGTATTIGKIKNLRVSETFQRGDVKGIGQLVATEKPILAINCTFTASSYFIDMRKLGNISNPFLRRGVNQTLSSFVDTILLTDAGVNLYLYKKIKGPDVPFRYVSDEPMKYDVQKRVPNVQKAKDILGFTAETSLDKALDEIIPWVSNMVEKNLI